MHRGEKIVFSVVCKKLTSRIMSTTKKGHAVKPTPPLSAVDDEPEEVLAVPVAKQAPVTAAAVALPRPLGQVDPQKAPDAMTFKFNALCPACEAQITFDLNCVVPRIPSFPWSLVSPELYEVECPRCDKAVDVGLLLPIWMKLKIKKLNGVGA